MADRYRERLPLIDGAVEAVERLAARWPVALASSANRPLIDLALELSGPRPLLPRDRLVRGGGARKAGARRLPRGLPPARRRAGACGSGRGLARRDRLGEGGPDARDRDPQPEPSRRATRRSRRPTSCSPRSRISPRRRWKAAGVTPDARRRTRPGTRRARPRDCPRPLSASSGAGASCRGLTPNRSVGQPARPKRTQPLWPPRPIAFESATSTCTRRASFGT